MAASRQKHDGDVVCYLIASLPAIVWGAKPLNPDMINPWKRQPAAVQKQLDELRAWRKKRLAELRSPKSAG